MKPIIPQIAVSPLAFKVVIQSLVLQALPEAVYQKSANWQQRIMSAWHTTEPCMPINSISIAS